jgi:anti-sigma28 factor (negative regulator of flagellin synthesis)
MAKDIDTETSADLAALAAAAHGEPVGPRLVRDQVRDAAREHRIAELRAQYRAGELLVDDEAVAAKLVDLLFNHPPDKRD